MGAGLNPRCSSLECSSLPQHLPAVFIFVVNLKVILEWPSEDIAYVSIIKYFGGLVTIAGFWLFFVFFFSSFILLFFLSFAFASSSFFQKINLLFNLRGLHSPAHSSSACGAESRNQKQFSHTDGRNPTTWVIKLLLPKTYSSSHSYRHTLQNM